MANYVFAYVGGATPENTTQEERDAEMAKWGVWYEELGAAIVDGGAPFSVSKRISSDGAVSDTGDDRLTGYTIVSADDLDTALAMAKGSPHLASGGTIEVAESIDMTPPE